MRRWFVMCAAVLCAASAKAQIVSCESLGGAYRECRVASSGTIRMVMEVSDKACFEDVTWGTHSIGIVWVNRGCRAMFTVGGPGAPKSGRNRVVCESSKGSREVCSADTGSGVVLQQQLSKANCVRDESWGIDPDRDTIWVDHGCRAEFFLGRTTEPAAAHTPLDSVVVCESENRRRKDCQADTTAGVQIVRSLSDSACGFGHEWGYDADGIWVTRGCRAEFVVRSKPKPNISSIDCESQNNTRIQCPAETQFGVAIIRQLGEGECIFGESWGFDETGVWVQDGCHGQFALGGYRLPQDAVPPTATKVVCESLDGGHKQCAVDASRGVGLIRQMSDHDCVLNRTWGYDRNGIWVTNGCRAEFAVAH